MPQTEKLSVIVNEIEAAIRGRFGGRTFWITAEINNVKKQPARRWCFLEFCERGEQGDVSIRGVCWARSYAAIEQFEKYSNTEFKSGIEITCRVSVAFYKNGSQPQLEILEIDLAAAIGRQELERDRVLQQLQQDKAATYDSDTGRYYTPNNTLPLPQVLQRIALVTAHNSDGQRDFNKTVLHNKYGYSFTVQEYLTQVQGIGASRMIMQQLEAIAASGDKYDAVVITRGGGSDNDFTAFNEYELAKHVALFPLPILTGIGHDRNTSITDLMARQYKTPTEVGNFIVECSFSFDMKLQRAKERLQLKVENLLHYARQRLDENRRRIISASPATILSRGFAIVKSGGRIITNPAAIAAGAQIETLLKNETIYSTVTNKTANGQPSNL